MRIRKRLLLLIFICIFAVSIPFAIFEVSDLYRKITQGSYDDNLSLLNNFSIPVAESIWSLDENYCRQIASSILLNNDITHVEIYDENLKLFVGAVKLPDGRIFFIKTTELFQDDNLAKLKNASASYSSVQMKGNNHIVAKLLWSQNHAGTLPFRGAILINYDLTDQINQIWIKALWTFTLIVLISLSVGIIIFTSIRWMVLLPLQRLSKALEQAAFNLQTRLEPNIENTQELKEIAQSFNHMMAELNRSHNLIIEQKKQIAMASKMSALGEMASGIAHEINNPLTIIAGNASIARKKLMQNTLNQEEGLRLVNKIESTVHRIANIIKGLRAFARNADQDEKTAVSLQQIIENTLEFCSQKFKINNIDMTIESVPHVKLICRESQIIQVLLNLLNNSYDAIIDLPSETKWIRVNFSLNSDNLEISITDSGPGIPHDIADKIMEPFFSTKEIGKGTGLGLSISKGIVEEHKGQFYLDQNSQYTRFVILFPKESFLLLDQANLVQS